MQALWLISNVYIILSECIDVFMLKERKEK